MVVAQQRVALEHGCRAWSKLLHASEKLSSPLNSAEGMLALGPGFPELDSVALPPVMAYSALGWNGCRTLLACCITESELSF